MRNRIKTAATLSGAKRDIRADFERTWAVKRLSPPLDTHHVTQKSTQLRKAFLAPGRVAKRSSLAQIT
jgi:hypothetical protein